MTITMTPSVARRVGRGIALGRTGLGLLAVSAPTAVSRPWVGAGAVDPAAQLLSRALGGRDLALGVGALLTPAPGRSASTWLRAGMLADLTDVVATLVHFRSLPRVGRWAVLAAAATSAVLAAAATTDLPRPG